MNEQLLRTIDIDYRLSLKLYVDTRNGKWEERWCIFLDGEKYNRTFQSIDTALVWAVALRNDKIRHAQAACFCVGASEL